MEEMKGKQWVDTLLFQCMKLSQINKYKKTQQLKLAGWLNSLHFPSTHAEILPYPQTVNTGTFIRNSESIRWGHTAANSVTLPWRIWDSGVNQLLTKWELCLYLACPHPHHICWVHGFDADKVMGGGCGPRSWSMANSKLPLECADPDRGSTLSSLMLLPWSTLVLLLPSLQERSLF